MMRAYDESYLDDAMQNLGDAMDYAVNTLGMEPDAFMDMFVTGGLAEQFGSGVPKYVAGMSGTELVWEVTNRAGQNIELPMAQIDYACSPEYWTGWILAYYQWFTGQSFKNIKNYISVKEVLDLYSTLHEAPEEKFVDVVNRRISKANAPTHLQTLRKAGGYSQKELAEKSGVALRMIQQYEQRAKDINKATVVNLFALARTLGCRAEDLLEYDVSEVPEYDNEQAEYESIEE